MNPRPKPTHLCRVCGWLHEDPPWGEDGDTPSYNICECCGVEFGYEDATPQATSRFRQAWLEGGAQGWDKARRPCNWDLGAQLARIGVQIA